MDHLFQSYLQIPPVTRAYTSICVVLTLLVQMDIVNTLQLYFNPTLVFRNFQLWRLLTTFCYFGPIGFNFFLNMLFIYQYCRMLEENSFRGRSADFLFMFIFGGVLMICIGMIHTMVFLGNAFTIMLVYVWSRRNPLVRLSFFGVLNFQAPYLPWVLLGFTFMLGSSILVDAIGIAVGHLYFFLEDVFPLQPNGFRILKTPAFLSYLIDGRQDVPAEPLPEEERPGGFNWGGD